MAETQRPPVSDTTLEDALNDKRFIQRQLKCALGEAPCDPIGKRLKSKWSIIVGKEIQIVACWHARAGMILQNAGMPVA